MKKFYKKGHLARRGKRWPALLMSICLIGTMLPVTARAEPDRVVSSNILSDYNTSFEGANDAGDLWWWNDASWGQTNIPRRAYGEAAKPAADCGDYYVQANPANIGDKAQCQMYIPTGVYRLHGVLEPASRKVRTTFTETEPMQI